jgi:hypothetical protein
VASPDYLYVRGDDVWDQSGRLRVVDVNDVAGPNELGELVGGLAQRGVVDVSLGRPKRPTIALGFMQAVVDPLRDPEEVRIPGDRHPAHVHTGPSRVRQQRMQELRDSSSARRRIHVPDHPPPQHVPRGGDSVVHLFIPLSEQRAEALRREGGNRDLLQRIHYTDPSGALTARATRPYTRGAAGLLD